MSETEKTKITTPFMSETEIAAKSVKALSNRPNEHSGQYGRKGLTPEELKAAFSALPEAIAAKMNELLPQILARFDETENAFNDADEALRAAITEAVSAAEGKLDRIEQTYAGSSLTYVYGVDKDGSTKLVKGNVGTEPSTLVFRSSDGHFSVKDPESVFHPVNKRYFDQKSNNSLYSEVTGLEKRMQNMESAATGKLYETVNVSGAYSTLQLGNALPYGILSRVGGATVWSGETELSFPAGESSIYDHDPNSELFIALESLEYIVAKSEASSFELVLPDGNRRFVFPTNTRITYEAGVFRQEVDGTIYDFPIELEIGNIWSVATFRCAASCTVLVGTLTAQRNPVNKISVGLPYTLTGSMTESGTPCAVTDGAVIMPEGATDGVLIPCVLPQGAKVKVNASGETVYGEKIIGAYFKTSDQANASGYVALGNTVTLTADSAFLNLIKENYSVQLFSDLEISDISIEIEDPGVATLYDPYTVVEFAPEMLAACPDYGISYDDRVYNYIDLTEKIYVRNCALVTGSVVKLATPETVDVSEYLENVSDVLPLKPYGLVRFTNDHSPVTGDSAGVCSLSYKAKIV